MKKLRIFFVALAFLATTLLSTVFTDASPLCFGKTAQLTGEIIMVNPGAPYNRELPALKTKDKTYLLSGNIKDLKNKTGSEGIFKGYFLKGSQEIPLFYVKSYKIPKKAEVTSTPIPSVTPTIPPNTPSSVILTEKDNGGYVYVKKGDEVRLVLVSNPTTGYKWNFDEEPDKSILLQTNYEYIPDNIDEEIAGSGGNEVWTFNALKTETAVMYLSYSRPWESVQPAKSFKVKVIVEELGSQPSNDALKGTLELIFEEMLPGQTTPTIYKYILQTGKEEYELRGNVKDLEKYYREEIEVTGNIDPSQDYYPPVFNVASYKLLNLPTPQPTHTSSTAIHTVISDEIYGFTDPIDGGKPINGYVTISWSESTQKAFFVSKIFVDQSNSVSVYEFELYEVKSLNNNSIEGLYNIKKNGKIVAEKINGRLYGLDTTVGSYFKFYSENEKWHLSAFVTSRIDF